MAVKGFIFDIDGTLIDSNDAHAETFIRAFKKFARVEVPFEEMRCLIGMGADKILDKYLCSREIEDFGEELKEFRTNIFLEEYLPCIETFPKLRELFELIESDGKELVLASSAGDAELEKYKQLMNISDLIEGETSADDVAESKPDPDIFRAAFQKLKTRNKQEVLVIGDTPYDAEAAVRADLKILGVESGGWKKEKLIDVGCAQVFRDIAEIYENYEDVKKWVVNGYSQNAETRTEYA